MSVRMPPGFEAKAVLGKGAMGTVYKAWQPKLKRNVAIKTCNIQGTVDAGQDPRRLEDEALTIARLNHPNIVALHDVLRDEQNIYLIMEILDGPPVSRFLNSRVDPEKLGDLVDMLDLSFSRVFRDEAACQIGIATARALDYAHNRGVLHRDVKPANIVVTRDRHVKLLDFSIAQDPNSSGEGRTITGTVFGTVQYMSPEQVLSNKLDGRTDIYSLGCTLYHMVAGEVPFVHKSDIDVCLSHVNDPPPDMLSLNPLIRPELTDIILKCLEKNPADRFENAGELAAALEDALKQMRTDSGLRLRRGDELEDLKISLSDTPAEEDAGEQEEAPRPAPKPRTPPDPGAAAAETDDGPEDSAWDSRPRRRLRDIASGAAGERGSGSAAPWLEESPAGGQPGSQSGGSGTGAVRVQDVANPPSPASAIPNSPPPAPAAPDRDDAAERRRLVILAAAAGGAVALVLVLIVLLLVAILSGGGDPPERSNAPAAGGTNTPDPVDVAALPPPTPDRETAVQPTPEPTPAPTPAPTPTATPETAPTPALLPVPDPPAVDDAIHRFRVPLPGGQEMVLRELPAGRFVFGSPPDEPGRGSDEGPRTEVTFSMPFYIGETEVTRGQWAAVMGDPPGTGDPDVPVTDVTWEQAQEFARRLSQETGLKFRLPAEAQWEYAARAGTASPFTFGEIISSDLVNFDGTLPYPRMPRSEFRGRLLPVRDLPPNAWGLYGVHGNAREFARDAWVPQLPGGEVTDPLPAAGSGEIAVRGGGFRDDAAETRSAARRNAGRNERRRDVGLRLVVEI